MVLFVLSFVFIFYQMNKVQGSFASLEAQSERALMASEIGSLFRSKYIRISDYERTGSFDEADYRERDQQLKEYIEALRERIDSSEAEKVFASIVENDQKFDKLVEDILNVTSKIDRSYYIAELDRVRSETIELTTQLTELTHEQMKQAGTTARSSINYMRDMYLIAFLLAALAGTVMFLLLGRYISRSLNNAVHVAEQISEGNLAVSQMAVTTRDELGTLSLALNKMVSHLRQLIEGIVRTAEQVASSSEQLTASAEETSKATNEIAESIQEVAAGADRQVTQTTEVKQIVGDISGGMEQIAHSVQQVNEASMQSAKQAENGTEVIKQTIKQMDVIDGTTQSAAELVEQLNAKSQEIGEIILLITEIAEQTNLLALNAAIEAARAGEHGRGFAVVADEVRKLAEQSGSSANRISQLISSIQEDIKQSVASMQQGRSAVQEGLAYVDQAGSAFTAITARVNDVSAQLQEVTAAVQQMTASTQSMVSNVQETAQVALEAADYSQKVAASVEEQNASMQEITASAENLAALAEELQKLVSRFKL
jgi:methyl-accepting chemotaxis protein